MKSIILLLALGTFFTGQSASVSEFKTNHYLTSFEGTLHNSDEVLPKFKKVTATVEPLSFDIENLKHQKTIDEVIAEDIKVIESNPFDTELSTIENLKREKSIEEIIIEDLKIIENNGASNF